MTRYLLFLKLQEDSILEYLSVSYVHIYLLCWLKFKHRLFSLSQNRTQCLQKTHNYGIN